MADVTPTTAIDNGNCVLTWGSNTYHGVTNWQRNASVTSTLTAISTSSGVDQIRVAGTSDVSFVIDILIGAGDATTLTAFQEETEETTCELHPEGDSAGNIELIFDDGGVVQNLTLGGSPGNPMIASITIGSLGSNTIQDAV